MFLVVNHRLKALFRQLTLEYLLLDSAGREKAIGEATLFLAVAPTPGSSLLVDRGVPVGILYPRQRETNNVSVSTRIRE